MKNTLLYLILLFCTVTYGQETTVSGKVLNASTDQELENVHIVNLTQVIGTITDDKGDFTIRASVNDTLYFSYIGYKPLRVRVTNDWTKFGDVKIKITELGIALEEVVVADVQLTGYLEIDAKRIPVYNNYRYSISGLNSGYEGGNKQPGAVNKVLGAIFNPADFLYNIDEILRNCNYSVDFIKFANDLQILDAISECYEEYKVLDRK